MVFSNEPGKGRDIESEIRFSGIKKSICSGVEPIDLTIHGPNIHGMSILVTEIKEGQMRIDFSHLPRRGLLLTGFFPSLMGILHPYKRKSDVFIRGSVSLKKFLPGNPKIRLFG
jgi:hypothetical protein